MTARGMGEDDATAALSAALDELCAVRAALGVKGGQNTVEAARALVVARDALRWVASEARSVVLCGGVLPRGSRLREALRAFDEVVRAARWAADRPRTARSRRAGR